MKIKLIFNEIKEFYEITQESFLRNCQMILLGMLGAMSVYGISHLIEEPAFRIGTVNITGIVNQFVKQEAAKNLSTYNLKKEVNSFGMQLNAQLQEFSQHNHIILFPSEAVIAGSRDYTELMTNMIRSKREV